MPQPDDARVTTTTVSGAPRRRVSISSHYEEIKRWVGEGYSDQSIAEALGTTASSVQSFRSRAGIRRQPAPSSSVDSGDQGEDGGARSTEEASTSGSTDPGRAAQATVYEGVLDQGEEQGYGLWLDPAIADDPLFEKGFTGVSDIRVVVQRGRIVLTPNPESAVEQSAGSEDHGLVDGEATRQLKPITDGTGSSSAEGSGISGPVEQGRIQRFNKHKGYGFILRPSGSQIFFHASELVDVPMEALSKGRKVSYEVSSNQQGTLAKAVKLSRYALS